VKSSVLFLSSAAVLCTAVLAAATIAQSPAGSSANATAPPVARSYPAPTNLKVLPKELTGQQVHEIMEQWSAALGAHCNACHVEDRNNIGPNGRPRLNFADDSKGMKIAARTMYTMTGKINTEYVAKIDSSGMPVTCGTCHRGHLGPEPFGTAPEIPLAASPDSQSKVEGPPIRQVEPASK
jgi:hypothetical protein